MPPSEEKVAKMDFDVGDLSTNDIDESELYQEEKKPEMESSEFALKMINSVKAMNNGELSHYEMVNAFSLADELRCLFMFIKALPHRPIVPMYPEAPFLFFKGVLLPRSFDLTEEMAHDIETFMKGKNSEYFIISDSIVGKINNFLGHFLHGLKLKSYEFKKYKTKKEIRNISLNVLGNKINLHLKTN